MEIKAVRMFDHGFMNQAFAFGGEDGKDKFDEQIIYRSSLQNFLIDTGSEVILVDTGFVNDFAAPEKKLGAPLYMGEKLKDYTQAFAELGYKPEQVTKILITHKHPDHSAAIPYFPNAKVFVSPEDADAMKLEGPNIVRCTYKDGPYHNFTRCEKIANGIYFIEAKGHTKGNSIIVAENDGLFYMMHRNARPCPRICRQQPDRLPLDALPRRLRKSRDEARDETVKSFAVSHLSCPPLYTCHPGLRAGISFFYISPDFGPYSIVPS